MENKQNNKIILLAPTPPPVGGIASWTGRMLNAKLPDGWSLCVVDEKIIGKREFFGDRKKYNLKNEVLRCIKIWSQLITQLNDPSAKIVHVCISANTLPIIREYISAIITKIMRRKFIIHFRCTIPNIVKSKINKYVLAKICKISDCVFLLNKQSEEYVKNVCSTKTTVIPNFVDTKEIYDKHNIKETIQRVVYVGGVTEQKGCIDLIRVAKRFPGIEFKLIGNPEKKCTIEAQGVSNVVLSGVKSHDEIKEELINADLFVFLSRFVGEGFSNALAEAMAVGLPCIVTDWAANKEMIEDKGGIVVPINNIPLVEKAINDLEKQEKRIICSEYNVNKVKTNYNNVIVIQQYIENYRSLINEKSN